MGRRLCCVTSAAQNEVLLGVSGTSAGRGVSSRVTADRNRQKYQGHFGPVEFSDHTAAPCRTGTEERPLESGSALGFFLQGSFSSFVCDCSA